jgi:hypothetical protein
MKTRRSRRFEGRALGCAATQYIQLVPKRDYLSFERTPRPEEVQEDPPEQIEKLEHPAFSPDSGAQTKRMEFAASPRPCPSGAFGMAIGSLIAPSDNVTPCWPSHDREIFDKPL